MQATNQTFQRFYNRALVLRQIRSEGRTSRVSLSRSLGLKKSSISNIVGELLDTGIVLEKEQGESTLAGGRRPIFLEIREDFCAFLGLEVQPNRYSAALVNLKGKVLYRKSGRTSTYRLGFAEALEAIFEEIASDLPPALPPVAAICLGVPGFVNPWDQEIIYSVPHGLENFSLGEIRNPWGLSVFAENDANCCAWGELTKGGGVGNQDFFTILAEFQEENPRLKQDVGVSTGFGVVLNGRIHYGKLFNAGEFRSYAWVVNRKGQMGIPDMDLLRIQEDPEVLDRYLQELLENLTPLVSVIQPEKLVFCGEARNMLPRICEILSTRMATGYLASLLASDSFVPCAEEVSPVAVGAAARLLEVLFQRPSLSGQSASLGLGWDEVFSKFA